MTTDTITNGIIDITENKQFKILVVDDSVVNIALISEVLKRQGYQIDSAIHGMQALEKANANSYDLILLDIMMPRMDGFEACQHLKQNPKTVNIPVIFLTAVTNTNSIIKGFEVGGVDFITKPFQNAELLKRVQTHIELKYSKEKLVEELEERKKAELEVVQNLKNQEFLSYISTQLLNIQNFDDTIHSVLIQLAKHINVSRAYILEKTETKGKCRKFEWCNESIASHEGDCVSLFCAHDIFWEQLFKTESAFCTSRVEDLPSEFSQFVMAEQIKSLAIVPFYVNKNFYGIIRFEECTHAREWKRSEVELIKTFSNLLSSVYERRFAHESLTASEEKFRNIFEKSNDCLIIMDFDGRVLEVNHMATQLFMYTREDLLKFSVFDIVTEPYKKVILEKIKSSQTISDNPINELEAISKDGRIIPLEVNSQIIRYMDSEVILSIARDLTERKQMERKILSVVIETEEKERNRFAKDLHDGLGALLSSINIYINLIRSGELGKAEQENMLIYTKGLVDEAIATAKEIANDLRPTILSRFGLVASVEQFCNQINNTRAIEIHFDSTGFNGNIDKNSEIILFRIINELINNTLKHADAKNIDIRFYNQTNSLFLEYHDNGKGFDLNQKPKDKKGGMGLENIRSRIKSINGNVEIDSKPDMGITVKIEIKL